MARPVLHDAETILDAAQELAVERGTKALTIGAIAEKSGAPIGSIYNRFGSRDVLLARMWIRAVRRSQAPFLAALDQEDPVEAVVAGALAVFDFCRDHAAEARLLALIRREDLLHRPLPASCQRELRELNRPLERSLRQLARRAFAAADRASVEAVLFASFDLPFAAARRALLAGNRPAAVMREDVECAARAVFARRLAVQ